MKPRHLARGGLAIVQLLAAASAAAATCDADGLSELNACIQAYPGPVDIRAIVDLALPSQPLPLRAGSVLDLDGHLLMTPGADWLAKGTLLLSGGALVNTSAVAQLDAGTIVFAARRASMLGTATDTRFVVRGELVLEPGATVTIGAPGVKGQVTLDPVAAALPAGTSTPAALTLAAGTLVLHGANFPQRVLPSLARVQLSPGAVLDLDGSDSTIAEIAGDGTILSETPSRLQLLRGRFDGLVAGAVTLVKTSTGTLVLAGENQASGGLEIRGGVLQLGASPLTIGAGSGDAVAESQAPAEPPATHGALSLALATHSTRILRLSYGASITPTVVASGVLHLSEPSQATAPATPRTLSASLIAQASLPGDAWRLRVQGSYAEACAHAASPAAFSGLCGAQWSLSGAIGAQLPTQGWTFSPQFGAAQLRPSAGLARSPGPRTAAFASLGVAPPFSSPAFDLRLQATTLRVSRAAAVPMGTLALDTEDAWTSRPAVADRTLSLLELRAAHSLGPQLKLVAGLSRAWGGRGGSSSRLTVGTELAW